MSIEGKSEPKILAVDRQGVFTFADDPGPVRATHIEPYKEHPDWAVWAIDDRDRLRDELHIPGMKELVEYFGLHRAHITRKMRLSGLLSMYPNFREAHYCTFIDYQLSRWNYIDPEMIADQPDRLLS